MFSFFKKSKPKIYPAFEFIGCDMHNHLLPGIDDGSPSAEESERLINGMMEMGFHSFSCTPHVISDVHPNTPETISAAASTLKSHLSAANKTIPMGYAAEYMVNFDFDKLVEDKSVLSFGDNNVLIEMSYAVESPNIREASFALLTKGYKPVLAHPERYTYYHRNFADYEKLLDGGCEFQVNMLSLLGYYGPHVKDTAKKLIERGWISWIGSDLHHERHLNGLLALANDKKAMALLHKVKDLKNPGLKIAGPSGQ